MTKQQKDLIMALVLHSLPGNNPGLAARKTLTKEEFFKAYPIDLKKENGYLLDVFENAYESKDSETIDYALMLIGYLDKPIKTYVPMFKKLLKAPWHDLHERILDLLISMKDKDNVDTIYDTAVESLRQDSDQSETIAVKAVWGLSKINTQDALEKIKRILDETSSEYVLEEGNKALTSARKA